MTRTTARFDFSPQSLGATRGRMIGRRFGWLGAGSLAAALTVSAFGFDCPPGATGSCAEIQPGPGCGNPVCCSDVCEVLASCCESAWDELCVAVADEVCQNLSCPSVGDCFAAHDGAGCEEYECCASTCALDAFCCFALWDEWCATEATQLCPPSICMLDVPPGTIDELEPCTSRLNDGCNLVSAPAFSLTACGETVTGVCTTGAPRDTDWWTFTLTEPRQILLEFESEFPGEALIVRGPCAATQTLARTATEDCGKASLTILLAPGQYWVVVAPATLVRPLSSGVWCEDDDPETSPPVFGVRYLATLSCEAPPASGDLNGDGVVDGADLGLLLSEWSRSGGVADLNGDGVVNGADLGLLLAAWSG
jgi:hypothetical protein